MSDVAAAAQACNLRCARFLCSLRLVFVVEHRNVFSAIGPLMRGEQQATGVEFKLNANGNCTSLINAIQATAFDDVDIYDIYADVCNRVNLEVVERLGRAGSPVHAALGRAIAGAKAKRSVLKPNVCSFHQLAFSLFH